MSTRIGSRPSPQPTNLKTLTHLAQNVLSERENLTNRGQFRVVALFCLIGEVSFTLFSSLLLSDNPGFAIAFIFPNCRDEKSFQFSVFSFQR
jgi:hypothetical protein